MADMTTLSATTRENLGKCPNRRMREAGQIPAVFYSAAGENVALSLDALEFEKCYRKVGKSKLFHLSIDGKDGLTTLVWQVQKHPYKRMIVHLDLFGVDMEKRVTINVPLRLVGTAPGLKLGGMMETFHQTMPVNCLPGDIPPHVDVDVSALNVGDAVTIQEVPLPENVVAVFKQNYALVAVTATRKAVSAAASASE